MRIAIVNLASVDGGGLTVLNDFYQYIKIDSIENHEWLFIVANQQLEPTKNIKVINLAKSKMSFLYRAYAELYSVPSILAKYQPDMVLSMQNTSIRYKKTVQMIYMHQSLPFQNEYKFSFFRRGELDSAIRQHILGYIIKNSLKDAKGIFVQTNWIRDAVIPFVGNSKVVKIGYNIPTNNIVTQGNKKLANNFFYPAGPAIYKNFNLIHEAVMLLEKQGIHNFKIYLTLTKEEFIKITNIRGSISSKFVFLGRIPYEKVWSLYKENNLLFPSYIETLGLPLLEAKANNSYILSSDCEFSRELLTDYKNVQFFNPFSKEELSRCMIEVLKGNVEISNDVDNVIINEQNCWQKMIAEMENIVKELNY